MLFRWIQEHDIPVISPVYLPYEDSFTITQESRSNVPQRYTSILVNDINIEVDDVGRFLYIWGFSPHSTWQQDLIIPPNAIQGRVVVELQQDLIPGVSHRLTEPNTWPVVLNSESGWIRIGEANPIDTQSVEFATNSIAVIRGAALIAIWVKIGNLDAIITETSNG